MSRRHFYRHSYQALDDGGLMNLTPLLDVLFVVLIFFILIAPLLDVDHIDLAGGKNETVEQLDTHCSIIIKVHQNKDIFLNGHQLSPEEIPSSLSLLYKNFPNAIPQLLQDKEAPFGIYQMIKNHLEKAGFKQMDVVLQ